MQHFINDFISHTQNITTNKTETLVDHAYN